MFILQDEHHAAILGGLSSAFDHPSARRPVDLAASAVFWCGNRSQWRRGPSKRMWPGWNSRMKCKCKQYTCLIVWLCMIMFDDLISYHFVLLILRIELMSHFFGNVLQLSLWVWGFSFALAVLSSGGKTLHSGFPSSNQDHFGKHVKAIAPQRKTMESESAKLELYD